MGLLITYEKKNVQNFFKIIGEVFQTKTKVMKNENFQICVNFF